MKKKLRMMPLFVDDYIADTHHLDRADHGSYLLLLMTSWERGPLPDDDTKLAAWARCRPQTWAKLRPRMAEFWIIKDGFWSNPRLERERDYVQKKVDVLKQNRSRISPRPERTEKVPQSRHKGYTPKNTRDFNDDFSASEPKSEPKSGGTYTIGTSYEVPISFFSNEKKGACAPSEDADLFERARAILGPKCGGMIVKLKVAKGGSIARARAALEEASTKARPAEYIAAVIRNAAAANQDPAMGIV